MTGGRIALRVLGLSRPRSRLRGRIARSWFPTNSPWTSTVPRHPAPPLPTTSDTQLCLRHPTLALARGVPRRSRELSLLPSRAQLTNTTDARHI